jgi:hypothetical protein
LGRPLAQTPSGSSPIFFQDEVYSIFQGPLLAAASTISRPPESLHSPFLMDLMSKKEELEAAWDFKMEIRKETSSFSLHSHFLLLTFIKHECETQGGQIFCIS